MGPIERFGPRGPIPSEESRNRTLRVNNRLSWKSNSKDSILGFFQESNRNWTSTGNYAENGGANQKAVRSMAKPGETPPCRVALFMQCGGKCNYLYINCADVCAEISLLISNLWILMQLHFIDARSNSLLL